jgi:hypothetical protein
MHKHLLMSTALCVVLAASAYAQSGSTTSSQDKTRPATETQQKPSTPSSGTSSQSSSPTTTPQAQTAPSTQSTKSGTNQTQSQPAPSQAQTTPADSSKSGTSTPSQAQSPSTNTRAQTPSSDSPSKTPPSQAQTPSNNTQAQQPAASTNSGTSAQQPSQTNVNAAVNINDQQRTRVTQSIARLNVQPVTNVNFSVSIGTVVPTSVRLQTLPADVVTIVPQYRGYSFFVVRDEIVIVEPSSKKIVTVISRSGGSAAAPAKSRAKVTFSDKDRDVVRRHVGSARAEQRTTGSTAARMEIRRGERLPDTIVLETFPDTVYRDAPVLRDYRYIHRENRTYLVDPDERLVIEEID